MKRLWRIRLLIAGGSLSVIMLVILFGAAYVRVNAQDTESADSGIVTAGEASVAAPVFEQLDWSAEPPVFTEEQLQILRDGEEGTHLSGPALDEAQQAPVVGPVAGTESALAEQRQRSGAPLAPGDHAVFSGIGFLYQIPSALTSNTLEGSVGQVGRYTFYTGNWFAARSTNNAANWSYVSPFSGMSSFCCDQIATYDPSRNNFYWLRMGIPSINAGTGNFENFFRLGVSTNWTASSFCNYDFTPLNVNGAWTNQWWDFPHIQLGADFLYITWNMFDWNGTVPRNDDFWVRAVIMRLPIDSLSSCSGFGYGYLAVTDWSTLVPVQNADHTMWFASNWPSAAPQNNRLRIYRWDENSGSISFTTKTVAAWTFTNDGDAHCGPSAGDWAQRADQGLLSGARYRIQNSNLTVQGRNVLGWWWNVAEGGGFARPYIEGAAFYEDNLAQVAGNQGRPYLWSPTVCVLFPSASANRRGDLGMILNTGTGSDYNPDIRFTYSDDYTTAPPGWSLYMIAGSTVRPADNKWGDYNTTRPFQPTGYVWAGAGHYLSGSTNCIDCGKPWYGVIGRARDVFSWRRWWWR